MYLVMKLVGVGLCTNPCESSDIDILIHLDCRLSSVTGKDWSDILSISDSYVDVWICACHVPVSQSIAVDQPIRQSSHS